MSQTETTDTDTAPAYETKTIRVHEPDRGEYRYIMICRFDGQETILREIGYTGVYYHYSVMSLNEKSRVADTDLFCLARRHGRLRDTHTFELLYALDTDVVEWSTIEDGDHLSPEDVQELIEG